MLTERQTIHQTYYELENRGNPSTNELTNYEKENNRSYTISWGLVSTFKTDANPRKCRLRLQEKLMILKDWKKLLNRRSDLFSACRHVN